MAMGRPPKPTALKVLAGNPGKRKLNTNEPKPKLTKGQRPPAHLSDDAKRHWLKLVPELERLGLLSVVDVGMLEMGCTAYSDWKEAVADMEENGKVQNIVREDGSVYRQQAPEVSIAKQAWEQYKGFCSEFGLSPGSRTRLRVAGEDRKDAEEERFFGS